MTVSELITYLESFYGGAKVYISRGCGCCNTMDELKLNMLEDDTQSAHVTFRSEHWWTEEDDDKETLEKRKV